jgi:hypothetical protein
MRHSAVFLNRFSAMMAGGGLASASTPTLPLWLLSKRELQQAILKSGHNTCSSSSGASSSSQPPRTSSPSPHVPCRRPPRCAVINALERPPHDTAPLTRLTQRPSRRKYILYTYTASSVARILPLQPHCAACPSCPVSALLSASRARKARCPVGRCSSTLRRLTLPRRVTCRSTTASRCARCVSAATALRSAALQEWRFHSGGPRAKDAVVFMGPACSTSAHFFRFWLQRARRAASHPPLQAAVRAMPQRLPHRRLPAPDLR